MNIQNISLSASEKLSEVGFLKQTSVKETFQLHTHDFYEFFFIEQGKAIHNVNDENILISKGSFVFIRPTDVHKYSFFNNYDIVLISCGIEPWLIEGACNYLNVDINEFLDPKLPPQIILEGSDYWDMKKKLEVIATQNRGKERKQYFLSILPQLIYLMTSKEQQHKDVLPIWLAKLVEDMNVPTNFIGGLPTMIEISNKCQEHLTREFRKHLGLTPTEFINTKRINYAAEVLLKREHEILDTCYMCGFNNLSYFYEVFKHQFNCTPKQFIKDNLKENK